MDLAVQSRKVPCAIKGHWVVIGAQSQVDTAPSGSGGGGVHLRFLFSSRACCCQRVTTKPKATFCRFSWNRGRSDGLFTSITYQLDTDSEGDLESPIPQLSQPLSSWTLTEQSTPYLLSLTPSGNTHMYLGEQERETLQCVQPLR